jgi:polyhydroxybutyrate depolymerase
MPMACAVGEHIVPPGLESDTMDGGWLFPFGGGAGGVSFAGGAPASAGHGVAESGGRQTFGAGGIRLGEGGRGPSITPGFGGFVVGGAGGAVNSGTAGTTPGGSASEAGGTSGGTPSPPAPPPPPPPPPPRSSTTTRVTTPGGRGFLLHVPAAVGAAPVPLLFVHHGYNGSADQIRQLTRFDALADEKGFVVAFPEGAGATWNAGLGVCGFGQFVTGLGDDFSFVAEMVTTIAAQAPVDRARVFTTGFSMGGYFANNIGCNRPDLVRGIAPHSGGGPPTGCKANPVPALILHGSIDSLIWYMCGQQARDAWVSHNRCSTQVDVVPVKGGACEWNRGCPRGGQVTFCHFDGMDHGWAGAVGKDGGGAQYEDVSRIIWDFFSKQ